jgi:hypothetical protein
MLLALRVCKVGSFICVEGKAQNVRILYNQLIKMKLKMLYQPYLCKVDSLKRELSETFTTVDIAF